jgi:hypothetical protein
VSRAPLPLARAAKDGRLHLAFGGLHFVLCSFRSGPAYIETDPQAAARTDIVRNMTAGEYEHPLRVLAVDVAARSVRDVFARGDPATG